jgi:1-acyl-sn-glycerol-3-phosphate acyltransferase
MSADDIARATLAGYSLIFCAVVVWRALRCPQGWRLWLLYVINSLYCRLCFHWRASRRCPFLQERSAIIIGNHRSPLDPLLIWVGMHNRRPLECLTAKEYFGIPGLQFIFEATHAIPVERKGKDMAATREALRRLKEGHYLGVFPEGQINTSPGMLPGDTGVAWLALHSQAPVYPVFIHDAPQANNMVSPFYTFTRVRISYGDAVDLSAYYGRRLTAELLQEVTDLLMRRLAALGGIPPAPDGESQGELPASVLRISDAG